jgi:hypothetical protein
VLDNKVNALLYDFVPVDVEVLQSNPNVLLDLMNVPDIFGKFGRAPSNPPWNGIMNFLVVVATLAVKYAVPVVNAVSTEPEYGAVNDGNAAAASCDTFPK